METVIVLLNMGDVFEHEGRLLQVQDQMYVMNGKVIMLNTAPEGETFTGDGTRVGQCVTLENIPVMQKVKVIKTATKEMLDRLSMDLFGKVGVL